MVWRGEAQDAAAEAWAGSAATGAIGRARQSATVWLMDFTRNHNTWGEKGAYCLYYSR